MALDGTSGGASETITHYGWTACAHFLKILYFTQNLVSESRRKEASLKIETVGLHIIINGIGRVID